MRDDNPANVDATSSTSKAADIILCAAHIFHDNNISTALLTFASPPNATITNLMKTTEFPVMAHTNYLTPCPY
jgi:hypothetical protein